MSGRSKQQLRILYLSYSYWPPDFGGELLLSIERLQALARRGHQIVALTSGKPAFPKVEVRDGIEVRRSPVVNPSRPGRAMRRLVYFTWAMWNLQRLNYDVVHFGSLPGLNGYTSTLFGRMMARRIAARNVRSIYVHSLANAEDKALQFLGAEGTSKYQFFEAIPCHISVSPAIHKDVEENFPDLETILAPCAVHDDIFIPLSADERASVRSKFGFRPDDVVFTFLGTVGQRKGFDLLAEAFAGLSQSHPNWKLLVIGPHTRQDSQNIDEADVKAVTAPLADNPNVVYIGRVDDRAYLAKLLGSSDVFAFPSRREGMGVAPMEAMSAGVPPIIALLPGITDQVNVEGKTGLYIKPGSVSELEKAMQTLGENPLLRKQMGLKARTRILEAFSWEIYIDQWENIYKGKT